MKVFKDDAEFFDFWRWSEKVTGSAYIPQESPAHFHALLAIYRNCKDDLLYLVQNPLKYDFAGWITNNDYTDKIPPLVANPKDPDFPDASGQLRWIRAKYREYCKELENSMIYKPMNMDELIDSLLNDPELSPIFTGRGV